MSKHTSGPWIMKPIRDFTHTIFQVEISNANNPYWVAKVNLYGNQEISRSNARLIAAAPEMYELLKAITNQLNDTWFSKDAEKLLKRIDA